MSDWAALLRQYESWEIGEDGYPDAWHRPSAVGPGGYRVRALMLSAENRRDEQPAIKDLIRELAGHRCLRCGHPYLKGNPLNSERSEWSPCDEQCWHEGPMREIDGFDGDGIEHTMTQAQWRILTVHHLDEDKANCRWWNLAALCQRCHLRMQRAVVMGRPYHFEHSEWFKPFAAGFYAWKYLGEDLGREETLERLPELLALEHRFTQEALL